MGRSRKILPVISDRPPPVFLTPTFAAAVSGSSGNFSHARSQKLSRTTSHSHDLSSEIGDQKITRVTVRATQISENLK